MRNRCGIKGKVIIELIGFNRLSRNTSLEVEKIVKKRRRIRKKIIRKG